MEALNTSDGSDFEAYLGMTTEDGWETDYSVVECEPEKSTKSSKMHKRVSVFYPSEYVTSHQEDMDVRKPTLRVDTDSVKVHHINSVKVSSSSYSVSRYKSDRRKNEF